MDPTPAELRESLALTQKWLRGAGLGLWTMASVWLAVPLVGQQAPRVIVREAGAPVHGALGRLVYDGVTIGQLEGALEYTFTRIIQVGVARDGSIYVLDSPFRGTPWLRVYDPNGRYVRGIGRPGRGPGEYIHLDGFGLLPDQRVLVLDGFLKRFTSYSPSGAVLKTWFAPYSVLHNGVPPSLVVGPTGMTAVLHQPPESIPRLPVYDDLDTRVVKVLRLDGSLLETREPPPTLGQKVVSRREGPRAVSATPLPYAPERQWFWSPLGYFVVTPHADRYTVDLMPAGKPVLRIARQVAPVPIPNAEREELRASTQRFLDAYKGEETGPFEIPKVKPLINTLFFDTDGRLLVSVATPSERFDPPEKRTRDGKVIPQVRWRSPVHYDFFEPDGKYIGQFAVPFGLKVRFVRGNQVWAVVQDEFDVEYLKKYRIVWQ